MTGFDTQWLALREPEDGKARCGFIIDEFTSFIGALPSPATVVDIGSGTGSTCRALSSRLPRNTRWKLVDYDRELLDEAARQIDPFVEIEFHQQDLNRFEDGLLDGASIVTASALFDLCSSGFCDAFIGKLEKRNTGLYAALNYNGEMTWTIPHPLDRQVVEDFNIHQTSNKGFGPALGPAATKYLHRICEDAKFNCLVGESPWKLSGDAKALQVEFLHGLKTPLLDVARLKEREIEEWLSFRLSHISIEGSVCIVGHTDLLALPRG